MAMSFLFLAAPVFAQGGEAASTVNWVAITAGFSMAIASGLCGLAQGESHRLRGRSLGRNPAARSGIQFALILGLALIESLALYTLAIIFAKVSSKGQSRVVSFSGTRKSLCSGRGFFT